MGGVAALSAATRASPADAATTGAETPYWVDQAALLDPAAYETLNGVWSRTVPAGEAWYLVAAGSLNWGAGVMSGYLREFNVGQAIMLPAGTTIGSAPGQTAAAHICEPSLVARKSRYSDPKKLYYSRLQRLKTLPIVEVLAQVPHGAPAATTARVDLPTDFENGLIVGASVYDAAWVTLAGWNMMDEVGNYNSVRFAHGLFAPFPRAKMPYVLMMGGNRAGDPTAPITSGQGSVLFHKLPADW